MNRFMPNFAYFLIPAACLVIMAAVLATPPSAGALGLKVSPLKYEEQIEPGSQKTGYVDVSNPNDGTVTVNTDVEAFRQTDIDGNLEYYEAERINKGIQFDVDQFQLAPREAARIFFAIDGSALPEGGVYAALLFSVGSEPPDEGEASSIGTTSRVGTLLILQNGDNGVRTGEISGVDVPFWQFGDGIQGNVEFTAADKERSIAFQPKLDSSLPIVGEREMDTGLVFPGNTRRFELDRTGRYSGVFPVEVTEEATGDTTRSWVVAATGIWQILAPLILVVLIANLVLLRRFQKTSALKKTASPKKRRHS
jgi:hypothetical protein